MKFLREAIKLATSDLASQLAVPVRSLPGWWLSHSSARRNKPLTAACLNAMRFSPDEKVLEIGYGRGAGLAQILRRLKDGDGVAYGIERSVYMEEVVRKKFVLELVEQHKLYLDRAVDLRILPYPSDYFAAMMHIDVFYFWREDHMPGICRELFRVLQPGRQIASALDNSQLKQYERWGMLTKSQCDPIRYLGRLENAGFVDVHVEYVDKIQLLLATKPEVTEAYFDPDERMRQLELDVKRQMVIDSMFQKGHKPTSEDLEILNHKS